MIEIRNSEPLQRWLLESGHLARLSSQPRFFFDSGEYDAELAGVRAQYPQFTAVEAEARTALRLLGKEEAQSRQPFPSPGMIAMPATSAESWSKGERRLHFFLLVLIAALLLLLWAKPAHGQDRHAGFQAARGDYVLGRPRPWNDALEGGQPSGVIWQWQQGGSALHTFAGGVGFINCSTNLTCSYSSSPPTITISASGGSGSGCIPPGTTANALLYDAGSGTCSDVAKLTWNSGTSTIALASGGILDPTAGTLKVPGTSGQLLYNNSGALGAEDPIVSGPDARGAAQSKNPVAGLAGIDYGTGCSGGPCVQEAKVDSSGNVYVDVTNTVPVSGTFWQATQPVSWSGQSVSLTGSWPYSGTLGAVTLTGSWPYSGALGTVGVTSLPALASGSNTIGAVTQATGPWTINLTQIAGGAPSATNPLWVTPTDGTNAIGAMANYGTSPGAVKALGVNAYVTNTVPVSGTFWQSTQPVSCTTANCSINVGQIGGNAVSTVANGTQEVGVADASGNGITSNSTTYSSKHGLDVNLLGALGTAFTTAGVVNIQGVSSGTAVPVSCSSGSVCPVNATLQASSGTDIGKLDANQSVNLTQIGGTTLAAANPCLANTPTAFAVNEATSSTTQLWAGSSGKHNWLCSIFLISATTQNINLITGTGTNCATVHAGLLGGTTAATGPNLAANTGFTLGNGAAVVAGGNDTSGDAVCYASSGSGQVSGVIMYVQQ